jgi:hypothetical protein
MLKVIGTSMWTPLIDSRLAGVFLCCMETFLHVAVRSAEGTLLEV